MAIQNEYFLADVQEGLFQNNPFMKTITDYSQYVFGTKIHIPNIGSNPGTKVNRASFPGTPVQRTDNDVELLLNWYSTDPVYVTNIEQAQVTYDKRQTIVRQHIDTLDEVITNKTCYQIAPATSGSSVIRTTGASSATALSSGATGTRSAVTYSDLCRLKDVLDMQKVPQQGRYLLVPSTLFNTQILPMQEVSQAQIFGAANIPGGNIIGGQILGMTILVRPTTVSYTNTGNLKGLDQDTCVMSATSTTDNLAIIAYHPRFLAQGRGVININYQEKSPIYYGNLFSIDMEHVAGKIRYDGVGTAALVQQA